MIVGNLAGDLDDVVVENATDKLKVAEYERFLEIEADGDDVFRIAFREPPYIFYLEFMLEQEFFVI